ncbi:hypothetical protein SAMN04515665_10413 [Blastococcus sp. DSM 46786]|uniref:hypothetical protein n=1 Tax=Blastococcus sp. DSM 46786 TaxID=1798227 RepID=UPI0008D83B22|nr:hypothetical protein [Blastococcus sp. DSM 46786]SEK64872.1 hypothetical protein SAMN04515665_10413 [Blastococcus sp. DSM 46786]
MNGRRAVLPLLLGAALVVVGALTLTPEGAGSSWGSPAEELRWYVTGLDSPVTVRQLLGNLGLLVVPAALAVLRWPALGRPSRLMAAAGSAGVAIELLQWALPLGRVVSPLDAALNATGAVVAGLVVAAATADRPRGGLVGRAGVPG